MESLRGWLNDHPLPAGTLLVAAFLLALALWMDKFNPNALGTGAAEPRAWFYEPATGKVFEDRFLRVPPFESPDGREAVRVHYFACGDCADSPRRVGYYEKFTPVAKARLEDDPTQMEFFEGVFESGRLWSIDGKAWLDSQTPEGRRLRIERMKELAEACGGKQPKPCCCP